MSGLSERYFWVYPPSGELWGFPKIMDTEVCEFTADFLEAHGFPETDVNWTRVWAATEEEAATYLKEE